MNEVSELIETLKAYEKKGMDTKKAMIKLLEEEDIVLMDILKTMGEKDNITLPKLIKKLEEKDPMKRLMNAIDAFADEEKHHPVEKV